MSPDVADMLRDLLLKQSIPVGDPNLVPIAALASKALRELHEVISEQSRGGNK